MVPKTDASELSTVLANKRRGEGMFFSPSPLFPQVLSESLLLQEGVNCLFFLLFFAEPAWLFALACVVCANADAVASLSVAAREGLSLFILAFFWSRRGVVGRSFARIVERRSSRRKRTTWEKDASCPETGKETKKRALKTH